MVPDAASEGADELIDGAGAGMGAGVAGAGMGAGAATGVSAGLLQAVNATTAAKLALNSRDLWMDVFMAISYWLFGAGRPQKNYR